MKREIPGPNYQDLSFRGGRLNSKPKGKQIQKKDRHCKIVTAGGLRDRRVRLSMDIARQFFDLQDLLGFDKASKTLDWLLTESSTAIKELVQMKQIQDHNTKNIYSSSECKGYDNVGDAKSMFSMRKGEEIFGEKSGVGFDSAAKELRAKARARARERTVEKKCKKTQVFDVLEPRKSCRQFGDAKTCACVLFCFCQPNGEADSEETFEKSGVITKKMKASTVNNLEMNSGTLTFSDLRPQLSNMNISRDLPEVIGGLQQ